jgi:hypothetical protein
LVPGYVGDSSPAEERGALFGGGEAPFDVDFAISQKPLLESPESFPVVSEARKGAFDGRRRLVPGSTVDDECFEEDSVVLVVERYTTLWEVEC